VVLVRAEIVGPDGHRVSLHFFGDATVGFELLVFAGEMVAIEKQELAAKEADARRPVFQRL
jgi:hypothetical protein